MPFLFCLTLGLALRLPSSRLAFRCLLAIHGHAARGLQVGWVHSQSEGTDRLKFFVDNLDFALTVDLALLDVVCLGIELEGTASVNASLSQFTGTDAEVAVRNLLKVTPALLVND